MTRVEIPQYRSLEWFSLPGGRWFAVVLLDRATPDFDFLVGKMVMIDNVLYHCIGVDRFSHSAPWSKGEKIAIAIDGQPQK